MDFLKGLVDEEAKKLLEAADEGRFPEPKQIAQLEEGEMNITVKGRISAVFPRRVYSKGSYRRIVIEDESGSVKVVLFNDQVEHTKRMMIGDEVLITNAYYESGELHLSPTSTLKIESTSKVLKPEELGEEGRVNIQGQVIEDEGQLYLECEGIAVRLSGRVSEALKGKEVVLSYVLFKDNALHVDERTRVFMKKA